jgi:hypothetical protein
MKLLVLVLGLFQPAMAQDCDVARLRTEVRDASPTRVAPRFAELAECNPKIAKGLTKGVFARMLPGPEADGAIRAAVEMGQGDIVHAWVGSLRSDERSATIKAIGKACTDSEVVAEFLVATHAELGRAFWDERWYRSLKTCRSEGIQDILRNEIAKTHTNRSRFFSVLEVYASNLGDESIMRLLELAGELEDPEELTYVVSAFADAAQVGSVAGQDMKATGAAVEALVSLVPTLDGAPLEQARTTLESLGALEEAARVPALRYADLLWDDGRFHYGLVAVETAQCKNGKIRLCAHNGSLAERGERFPHTVKAAAAEATSYTWVFPIAAKCKGRQTLDFFVSPMPFASPEEIALFHQEVAKLLEARVATKRTKVAEKREVPL